MFKKVEAQVNFPKMEEAILRFWDEEKIFEKSVANREGKPQYSFYDGPPFATGTPHYGHIVASAIKDTVPRYFTMKGFQVERRWGWDCHGLPIENIAEKELGITHKKEILELGVEKFNEICRSKVLKYVAEWKKVIRRFGRFADMDNAYKTMDLSYMESVWWVFKELWDKGLIYESYRTMHICPRCETTLSQSEVAEGYQMVKDLAVTAKFELIDPVKSSEASDHGASEPKTYLLAWTTTPWTLPGNVALAVNKDIEYVKVKTKIGTYILAEEVHKQWCKRFEEDSTFKLKFTAPQTTEEGGDYAKLKEHPLYEMYSLIRHGKIQSKIPGEDLVGKSYKPPFSFVQDALKSGKTLVSIKEPYSSKSAAPPFARNVKENWEEKNKETNLSLELRDALEERGWHIYDAKFVTDQEGTGIVHIAPGFGEDDYNLCQREDVKLPIIQHVGLDGIILDEIGVDSLTGQSVKPKGEDKIRLGTDIAILKYLQDKETFFSKENITHSYPHCWRCDTPLLNYATSSWFVSVTKVKERALKLAEEIHWSPEHIKEGRFGQWLEGARDWSISRQRFWASVIPLWKCEGQLTVNNQQKTGSGCGNMVVFGSVKDLEEASGKKVTDLHKHTVDKITVTCEKCGGVMRRIPDVLDTWFDSGSMPYAQAHYPFENKEKFEKSFPAQFIAEGIDQTRAWFYYLHVIATSIKDSNAFQNVVVNGIVLAEDGKKMAKKLQNYPDPMAILNKYGADVLRYYLLSSPVVAAENLNFSERDLNDVSRNVFRMLWNSYSFFTTYTSIDEWQPTANNQQSTNILDRWILSELQLLIQEVEDAMEKYELSRATRLFMPFIDNLSNWYIRRSRKRFWKSEDDSDKENAYQTLYDVLVTLSKVMAPFTPFLSEEIYKNLTGKESVHLADWPTIKKELIDEKLNEEMQNVRYAVNSGLEVRASKKIKVRQPLGYLQTNDKNLKLFEDILAEELNVKGVNFVEHVEKSGPDFVIKHHNPLLKQDETKFVIDVKKWIAINVEITPELKLEGEAREIIRAIQEGRKKAKFNVEDRITLGYTGKEKVFEKFGDLIAKEVLATSVENKDLSDVEYNETVKIESEDFTFALKRVK